MIEVGQIWRGKGKGRRYEVQIVKVGRSRITLRRTKGGPVGGYLRVHREQLTSAYEPIPPEGG